MTNTVWYKIPANKYNPEKEDMTERIWLDVQVTDGKIVSMSESDSHNFAKEEEPEEEPKKENEVWKSSELWGFDK